MCEQPVTNLDSYFWGRQPSILVPDPETYFYVGGLVPPFRKHYNTLAVIRIALQRNIVPAGESAPATFAQSRSLDLLLGPQGLVFADEREDKI